MPKKRKAKVKKKQMRPSATGTKPKPRKAKKKWPKKPALAGGLYKLKAPKVAGWFSVIAPNKKEATRMFRELLRVKRLPVGATVTKSSVAVSRSCKIVCK